MFATKGNTVASTVEEDIKCNLTKWGVDKSTFYKFHKEVINSAATLRVLS